MRILSFLIYLVWLLLANQKTESPHGSDFKISCKTCHSSKGWQLDKSVYSFDHNTTRLPLVGQHLQVNCRTCHTTLIFKEAKNKCNDCHNDIHQATAGLDCSRCHTPVSWLVNNIVEIHRTSRFPLVGAHVTAECIQCHKSENLVRFDVPGVNCIDCHRQNYLATTSPNHVQAGISQDCFSCHPVSSFQWTGASFNHSMFPLVQGHSTAKCIDCHSTTSFADAKPDCYTCHQKDYVATTSPNHVSAKLGTVCQDCHSLAPGWSPTTFDHTKFPLKLGHSTAACVDCHKTGTFAAIPADCYSCHQQDYTSTTSPNHVSAGYAKTCETCHTLTPGWKPASFNHGSFPLTLGHSALACTACHIGGNFTSTSADCFSCHATAYNSTTNPNHKASNFPTTCGACHSTNPGWKPASFNHTIFPLTLGHAGVACADCHKNGNYTTTPKDCYTCHLTDYNTTTNPNHKSLNFATVCTTCHTTNPGWKPASYTQHDSQFFPIYSGNHRGRWTQCTDCHTNTANYALFNCITCHKDAHRGKNYTDAQCYSCHPRGSGG